MLHKLNWIDLLILKTLVKKGKIYLKEIRYEIEDYFKNRKAVKKDISYNYVYQRVEFLKKLGLVTVVSQKPMILKINPELYQEVTRFILAYADLEAKCWWK